jgi:hypothetical protein
MPPIVTESSTPEATAEPKPLPTPIRWLLVIPAAIGGALGMAVIAVLIVLFSGVSDGVDDLGTIGAFILVFMVLSCPMASINVGAGQAPGHKETAALVLAALWGIGLTLALVYVAAMGVSGAGNWLLLGACCFAGINGVVWGFYYARTEGEAAK